MAIYTKPTRVNLIGLETILAVKAQSGPVLFNETLQQTYSDSNGGFCSAQGNLVFNFPAEGITPTGDGTLTAFATGDIDSDASEAYTINFEGTNLSPLLGGNLAFGECALPGATEVYTIPLSLLQNATANGTIQITASPGINIGCNCTGEPNQVTLTLEFQGNQ